MKVLLVASAGGHFEQLLQLLPALDGHDLVFVTDDRNPPRGGLPGPVHYLTKSQRDWRVLRNLAEAWRLLRREQPRVIVSTGAGCAVPVFLVGRLLGCRTLFIETFSAVRRPSLTGRLLYRVADVFVYQWEGLRAHYPRGVYGGPCFDLRDHGHA